MGRSKQSKSGPNNGPHSAGPGRSKHVTTGRMHARVCGEKRRLTLFDADAKLYKHLMYKVVGVLPPAGLSLLVHVTRSRTDKNRSAANAFMCLCVCKNTFEVKKSETRRWWTSGTRLPLETRVAFRGGTAPDNQQTGCQIACLSPHSGLQAFCRCA